MRGGFLFVCFCFVFLKFPGASNTQQSLGTTGLRIPVSWPAAKQDGPVWNEGGEAKMELNLKNPEEANP